MPSAKAFFDSESGCWGVHRDGCVIYHAIFTARAAKRIARLENRKTPPEDWAETMAILMHEGLADEDIFQGCADGDRGNENAMV